MDHREEFKRTIVFGETSIGHLKANETPAYPRNYELWYTYAVGFNQALNRAINELLRRNGHLSPEETERTYDEHLSPLRFGDRIEHIGGQLSAELRSIVTTIEGARSDAASYGNTLRGASSSLQSSSADSGALKAVVEKLLADTRRMEERNGALEKQLVDSKRQIDDLQTTLEAIRSESLTDPLTGLSNRKCFDQGLARAIAEAEETGKPLSLLMTDIDHFKKFNDTYGHQTGDQVLRLVATALKQNVKGQDIAARYGGEEFGVVLPKTALDAAMKVGEHIREAVMSKELVKRSTGERLGRITISIGIATWKPGDGSVSLIERADTALYRAKHTGRNRVCTERDLAAKAAVA